MVITQLLAGASGVWSLEFGQASGFHVSLRHKESTPAPIYNLDRWANGYRFISASVFFSDSLPTI